MTTQEINNAPREDYSLPVDAKVFMDEFIVFFSDEDNPKVLFHSLNPTEAYIKAQEIFSEKGKMPTVTRVIKERDNVAKFLFSKV